MNGYGNPHCATCGGRGSVIDLDCKCDPEPHDHSYPCPDCVAPSGTIFEERPTP